MKKTIGTMFTRSWIVAFEAFAVLAGLAILLAAGLFWRLSNGPINIAFLRPYIEDALSDPARGLSVKIGQVVLEWDRSAGTPILLGLEDFRLIQAGERTLFSLDRAAASLSLPMLVLGRVEPRTVVLDGPAIRLVRREDSLQFGSDAWAFSIPLSLLSPSVPVPPEQDVARENEAGVWLWNLTASHDNERKALPSVLQKLRTIEIRHVKLMVEDRVNGVSWFLPRTDFTYTNRHGLLSLDIGLGSSEASRGTLKIDVARGDAPETIDLRLSARRIDPRLFADRFGPMAVLRGQDVLVDLDGSARLGKDLLLRDSRLVVSTGAAALDIPQLYTHPLPIESFRVEALYDSGENTLEIPSAVLRAEGVDLTLSAKAVRDGAIVDFTAKAALSDLSTKTLQSIYPDDAPEDHSREWVRERISNGDFRDVRADIGAKINMETNAIDFTRLVASFAFDGVSVNYREPLMPVENAKGIGTLDIVKNVLAFEGESATIGDMKARNIHVIFDDVMTAGRGMADIGFDISGPLATGLRYIESEPIALGDDLGLDPGTVRGKADFNVKISFPAIRDLLAEQVKVKVRGTMSDLFLPGVVKGLALTGGPLTLETTDGSFRVAGRGSLADRPVSLDWLQYLQRKGAPFSSQVKASLDADKALRDHFGVDVDDFISGTVPVALTYTEYGGGRSQAQVQADLGPVRAMIAPFAYDKMPGGAGRVTLRATLEKGDLKEIQDFEVEAPDLKISGGRLAFEASSLRRADFKSFRVGETDIALEVVRSGPDSPLKITMTGPFLDARPFLNPQGNKGGDGASYEGPAISASVNAARLRTKDARVIESARVALDMDRGGDLTRIDARARIGAGDFFMRLAPDAGGIPFLRIEAQDAGSTLRAFNVYENVLGGKLLAIGKPSGKGRNKDIAGTVTIENFKVVNAPVLAQLVSALSLPGLLQLLGNDGLGFSKAQAQFEWKIRDTGTSYVFREGRTSGNSLGLTFDGVVDKTANTLDISGTIVPVSEVNSLLSGIPLIGDILTGGSDGGILAATYSVKGNADAPKVMVNPLAALAPGILRRIFFEGEKPSEKSERKDKADSVRVPRSAPPRSRTNR
ncbi:MAG: AsmA-like C-terminal domain-containing protein [Rhodospirillales bacterium]|nr:AsmA-like C-terminal domain-containing protein [Rhodospirillales bacterium]